MATDTDRAVQRLCLAFPESEEIVSHGSPNYRVRKGKVFVIYARDHHGDGRIALWLAMPSGVQEAKTQAEPKYFFVPPYVGPRGWLGVRLDRGLTWSRVAELTRMAYEHIAPARLAAQLGATPRTPAPKRAASVAEIDPRKSPQGKRVLAAMRKLCLELPESSEALQFGQPVWRAGKKVFAQAYCYEGIWRVAFWVGVSAQGLMTEDSRYSIPPYMGHNGWIALDVSKRIDARELRSLALMSYQHFALKRMLAALGPVANAAQANHIPRRRSR
jgi:predicted DNA-binding protein (MmcQ/YjbR family)